MISTSHVLIGGLAWITAAAIVAFLLGRAIGIADERDRQPSGPCCGTGHPESGPDDSPDAGLDVLTPRTQPLSAVRLDVQA